MKTQKFFSVTLVFTNHDYTLGRNVVESWLQFFFESDLRGKELADFVGEREIHLVKIGDENYYSEDSWWENVYAVKKIRTK